MAEFTFPGIRVLLLCFFFLPLFRLLHSEPTQDREALLDFISSVRHSNRIQWSANQSACNWVGVGCDPNQSSVFSLRLPAAGLVGSIPANTIGRLSQLRVLSLRLNGLSGQIPSDFSNLKLLRSLYLQGNQFSGEFPIGIPELTGLTRLDLSGNNFSGSLPFALNNLTTLTVLFLENNGFSGDLTSINITSLTEFNISNNQINGSIPDSLSGFPASAFAGNIGLCGGPLPPCGESPPPLSPPESPIGRKSSKLSTAAIVGISIGAGFLLLLLLLLLIVCLRRRKRRIGAKTQNPSPVGAPAATSLAAGVPSSSREIDMTSSSAEGADRTKLVFFAGGNYKFDLEDLLRASAEVLGKGTVGTSYKAVLEEGTVVVVKRLRDVVVSKKDFESQMEIIGKIRINDNVNVVSLQAYYYSKDEKLLVSDYIAAGSLSSLLHGIRGSGRTPLNWDSRVKIAIGAGRGLASLHVSGNVVHGNIKASNILLRSDHVAAVSDFGLNPLFETGMPPNRVAGYRAPEMVENRKPSFKSDVYSFGVLLLELLTGKSPTQSSLGEDEGVDLPRWVQSVVREVWTAEVFDVELMRYQNIEEEMVQLLQIAMTCVSPVPDQRPTMPDVVRMIEELPMNRTPAAADTDDGIRQSSDEPS